MAGVINEVPLRDDRRWVQALESVVVDADLLRLHGQPIVELASGSVAGYEMLSRFTGPWQATPDVWFSAADRWGFNAILQARVLRAGLAARELLPPDTFLTVNIDPHLLAEPEVADALTQVGDLTRFVLELTEHTRTANDVGTTAVIAHVRAAGGLLAMDDAGTGYAGLSALLELRPHIVKLDREFITGLDTDPVKRALVEVFGDLAGRMDAWILAEGIETSEELDAVIRLGVPLGQGWALARPAPTMLRELSPALVDHIRATAAKSSLQEYVASLVRPALAGEDPATCAVILDDVGRARMTGDNRGGWAPAMLVAPSTTVQEAARRAMTRGLEHRYAPLVCTDGQGQVLGTIGIDDLLISAVCSGEAAGGR